MPKSGSPWQARKPRPAARLSGSGTSRWAWKATGRTRAPLPGRRPRSAMRTVRVCRCRRTFRRSGAGWSGRFWRLQRPGAELMAERPNTMCRRRTSCAPSHCRTPARRRNGAASGNATGVSASSTALSFRWASSPAGTATSPSSDARGGTGGGSRRRWATPNGRAGRASTIRSPWQGTAPKRTGSWKKRWRTRRGTGFWRAAWRKARSSPPFTATARRWSEACSGPVSKSRPCRFWRRPRTMERQPASGSGAARRARWRA